MRARWALRSASSLASPRAAPGKSGSSAPSSSGPTRTTATRRRSGLRRSGTRARDLRYLPRPFVAAGRGPSPKRVTRSASRWYPPRGLPRPAGHPRPRRTCRPPSRRGRGRIRAGKARLHERVVVKCRIRVPSDAERALRREIAREDRRGSGPDAGDRARFLAGEGEGREPAPVAHERRGGAPARGLGLAARRLGRGVGSANGRGAAGLEPPRGGAREGTPMRSRRARRRGPSSRASCRPRRSARRTGASGAVRPRQ